MQIPLFPDQFTSRCLGIGASIIQANPTAIQISISAAPNGGCDVQFTQNWDPQNIYPGAPSTAVGTYQHQSLRWDGPAGTKTYGIKCDVTGNIFSICTTTLNGYSQEPAGIHSANMRTLSTVTYSKPTSLVFTGLGISQGLEKLTNTIPSTIMTSTTVSPASTATNSAAVEQTSMPTSTVTTNTAAGSSTTSAIQVQHYQRLRD